MCLSLHHTNILFAPFQFPSLCVLTALQFTVLFSSSSLQLSTFYSCRALHNSIPCVVDVMGFGPSESWLPTRGTTVALCTTLIAAVIALYVYKSVSSRHSRHVRTPHVSSNFDIVRLCKEIQHETLTTIDHSVRTIVNDQTNTPSVYTFYQKDRTVEQSAIVTASRFGRVDVVKYFLHNYPECVKVDQSANLDVPIGRHHCMREVHDCSALYAACFNGSVDTVTHLLQARASLKKTDCIRRTPLQVAAQRGHTQLVEYLLARGAAVNAADSHGYTPLLSAVVERNKDVVQLLLDSGADPCLKANNGHTALHIAAELGSKPIVELLLQKKSLSCPRDHDTKHRLAPPYILAASRGHLPTCQLLLKAMNLTPAQTPDVLLLWGAAQVCPQHRYIHQSVQKWWTEAMELRQQHHSISLSLTPLEVYDYRSEMSTVDEVAALFSSNPPSSESYEEITYQSLLIMERCLGYGDSLVIQKILEASHYLLEKRKWYQAEKLLCRALEMSTDRCSFWDLANYCQTDEHEWETKVTLKHTCDLLNEMLKHGYDGLHFSTYLSYAVAAFKPFEDKARLSCKDSPAKVNSHLVLLLLSLLAAWVQHKVSYYRHSDSSDVSDSSLDLTELDRCESLARKLVEQHLFIMNEGTLLHLTLTKLGTRDSLLPQYIFLKNLSSFLDSLLSWGANRVVNLANVDGERPLHLAASRARTEYEAHQLLTPLLRYRVHRDAMNASGKTAVEVQRCRVLRPSLPGSLQCLVSSFLIGESERDGSINFFEHLKDTDRYMLGLHCPATATTEYEKRLYKHLNLVHR